MLPQRRPRKKGRVEIIPMIDVMLFLLVFFIMITLQMVTDRGLKIQLPGSSQAHVLPHPHFVVNIQADGRVTLKGKTMDLAGLTRFLAADGDAGGTQITVAADRMVPFRDFVHVMGACRKAGVTRIGIAARNS